MTIPEQQINSSSLSAPLVLAGAGHAHLVAIRVWAEAGLRVPEGSVLVSPTSKAWYSGMMPGMIAGRFTPEACAIDLQPLCKKVGLRLISVGIASCHASEKRLELTDGASLSYKVLSINTGSQPPTLTSDGSIQQVPAKPFPAFKEQWQYWMHEAPSRLTVVGGGAAAFELTLALQKSLPHTKTSLVFNGRLLDGHSRHLQALAGRLLRNRGVSVYEQTRVTRIEQGRLWAEGQALPDTGALVLATGARALPWYADSGLQQDDDGFLAVGNTLQSKNHPDVFVSGDAATLMSTAKPHPRSGVYAVRHGPVIAHNVLASFSADSLQTFQPQRQALALLATADGGALMSYGRFSAGTAWLRPLLGRWKDYLDLEFMRRHRL
ncbi:FAD-dependent oxidoreductase [Pseudohongiella spirulinae]|uniref:Pyridine nucleotide-disulfide oxidoreductase family protein n=1 Tax=Pseudohongiella spirulinae TaxID=1249552 RepID=A0A0S2KB41_9GAMM|nr:FAD-dependent oxidoreductase [Pseudohongiella spirulinae]ALO45514.1 Pyridine nucleotide-disulfide oxidoreductase family protein [Pseudohongiella spirulinae]